MHPDGSLAIGTLFESAKGRTRSQPSVLFDGALPNQIMSQSLVIGKILVALGDPENALPQQVFLGVGDKSWIPRIW